MATGEFFGTKAEPVHCAEAEVLNEDVGLRHQGLEALVLVRVSEVHEGGAHADIHIEDERFMLERLVACDVQHLGSIFGQCAR